MTDEPERSRDFEELETQIQEQIRNKDPRWQCRQR
jgi:hypothetical protein